MSFLYKNTDDKDISEFLSQTSNSEHALDLSELGYGVADHSGTNNPEYTDATKNTEITSSGSGFTFNGNDPFQTANSDGQRPVSYFTHAVNQTTNSSVQGDINIADNDAPSWATHCRIIFAGAGGGGGGSTSSNVGRSGGSGALFISDTIPLTGSDALDSITYYLGHGGTGGEAQGGGTNQGEGQYGGNSQLKLNFADKSIDIRVGSGAGGGGSVVSSDVGIGGYFYSSSSPNFPDTGALQYINGNIGVHTISTGAYNYSNNFYASSFYGTASNIWKYYGWSSIGSAGQSSNGNYIGGNLSQWSGNYNYLRSYILQEMGRGGDGGKSTPENGQDGKGAEIYVHWLPEDINFDADDAAVVSGLLLRFDYTDGTQKSWIAPFIGDNGYDLTVTIVGGGGGGGGSDSNNDEYNGTGGGGGGEGGKVTTQTYSNIAGNTIFYYTVGGGGGGGRGGVNDPGPPYVFNSPDDGNDGSSSSISFSSNSLTAAGGSGGKKSTTPHPGQGGGSGTGAGYTGQSGTSSSGGSGGNGGLDSANERGTAGNGGGEDANGGNGSYGGGGGGAGGPPPSQWDVDGPALSGKKGGNGGNGFIEIRWSVRFY